MSKYVTGPLITACSLLRLTTKLSRMCTPEFLHDISSEKNNNNNIFAFPNTQMVLRGKKEC